MWLPNCTGFSNQNLLIYKLFVVSLLLKLFLHYCHCWNKRGPNDLTACSNPSIKARMNDNSSWPRRVKFGRVSIPVYRRLTPSGNPTYRVANYVDGKRRFDDYQDEDTALRTALTLAKHLSAGHAAAASLTQAQALEYIAASAAFASVGLTLTSAASTVAEVLRQVGGLAGLHAAAKLWASQHASITPRTVAQVVQEFRASKQACGVSSVYIQDIDYRLGRFAASFQCNLDSITTGEVQAWLDRLLSAEELAPGSYRNFRGILHTFFAFGVARGYCATNPVSKIEQIDIRDREIGIFTPAEMELLLEKAEPDYLPVLAIGAFAGVRTAELARLTWGDINLDGKMIVVQKTVAKTGRRRIVPMTDNLVAWLRTVKGTPTAGKVWPDCRAGLLRAHYRTAVAAGVKWVKNGLRHSYASYRFAESTDAGRVSGEMGNSADVVHRHYKELVTAEMARQWFSILPK